MLPQDADLRDFPFMPLDVLRFRDSGMAAMKDPEAFRAGVIAFCVAWHQLPPASLPADDEELCRLLGYGRDIKLWRKVRAAGALRGWVEGHDGRLHHPVVAEKAVRAWTGKLAQRERTSAARAARAARRQTDDSSAGDGASDGVDCSVTDSVTDSNGKGESERDGKRKGQREGLSPPDPRNSTSDKAGFEGFWNLYPKKVAKCAAEQAWPHAVAAANGNVQEILDGLVASLRSETLDPLDGPQFVPNPGKWLSDRRWLDDLEDGS